MGDCVTFPKTFEEFAEEYKILDSKEIYTNGTELIPIFRVKQWIEHSEEIINRLQAENEDLEKEIDKQYEQARADILGNMADGGMSCHWCIEQHKAEAYKECIEKVKVYFRETRFAYDAENLCEELDELLEEKLGK